MHCNLFRGHLIHRAMTSSSVRLHEPYCKSRFFGPLRSAGFEFGHVPWYTVIRQRLFDFLMCVSAEQCYSPRHSGLFRTNFRQDLSCDAPIEAFRRVSIPTVLATASPTANTWPCLAQLESGEDMIIASATLFDQLALSDTQPSLVFLDQPLTGG